MYHIKLDTYYQSQQSVVSGQHGHCIGIIHGIIPLTFSASATNSLNDISSPIIRSSFGQVSRSRAATKNRATSKVYVNVNNSSPVLGMAAALFAKSMAKALGGRYEFRRELAK